ncbi:LytR/AlgR family response regulator transcription factor [Adhaeribacter radiodurans]|uniref:LytTR family transcriptional regulator n=1 Tax=Adhaeribacter radiodurans TaxID=2745197 RepID=A0A7L7L8B2_9BACT|nr:LytTR family DNA-binding domain-containing protein [Adhaeribacter radiodurans]QMU28639.1 LytTR family transcriptional regulator [Adhaeribacter radiodurans]
MPAELTPLQPLPVYHDKWIRIIGIPVITAFGYYLTYDDIQFNSWFVYEVLSDAVKIFLVWQMVRLIITQLDKHYPWQQNFVVRLVIQIIATCVTGILSLSILVLLEYRFIRPYQMEHYWSLDVIIALIFLLFINGIYIGLYFYDSYLYTQSEKESLVQVLQQETSVNHEHLLVRSGKKEIRVPYPEISCAYSEAKETYLLTADNKTYLLDLSLDRLEEQLPESLFFRANRKFILTADLIESFTTETHGKLTVQLKPHSKLPESFTISRDKAPAFRRWLKR